MFSSLETLILSFMSLFVMMFFIRSKWVSSYSKMKKNLPPSPFGLPIIGNLHQLGSATHVSLRALARKHGSLILIHLGSVPVVLVSSAEAAQEIMKTHDIIFATLGRKYYEDSFRDLLKELMEVVGHFSVGSYVPSLAWMDRLTGLEGRAYKIAKQLDAFMEGVVKDHENKSNESGINQDFVDILLEIQREQADTATPIHRDTIKASIQETFIGGSDTTSTSLEWAISEIIKHPKVMKKLQQELNEIAQGRQRITEEDLENTQHPYLNAVIKETMRLHPPLPLLVRREATKDAKLMGYDIEAGTQVIINAWMISRDPTVWEEAEEFKPERFLDSTIDYKGFDFEFIPFGSGRRVCPGIQFAISVNKLALANLVYKFEFKLPNERKGEQLDMSESTGISVRRKYPLLVIPMPRL